MVFENRLDNGVKVVGDMLPHFTSVSLGVWIGAGSICEHADEGGISHFIEHMLFKSTKNRTPAQIAVEMDSIGGNLNAFTSKECTCYYAKTLDRDLSTAADILSDMIHNPLLDSDDIEREKSVVCEEILMAEDSPEDVVHETLCSLAYQGDPLSLPITGTRESVMSFDKNALSSYMDRLYTPGNMVVACAGNFNEDELMRIISDRFSLAQKPNPEIPTCGEFSHERRFCSIVKDVEQAHIALALPGVALGDDLSYPVHILNNVLGASMSSRLFQNIREKRGLAYSVYSYSSMYRGTGYLSLYAGTAPARCETVTNLMLEELLSMRRDGITDEEFSRAKRQLKNSFLMGQESTTTRSSSLGRSMTLRGRIVSQEEILNDLEKATMDDVRAAIDRIIDFDRIVCSFVSGREGADHESALRDMIMSFNG